MVMEIALPDIGEIFATIIDFVYTYWYVFVILIFGGLALGFYIKSKKKKIEYYSQIEENKKLLTKELEYNPPDFKWIAHFDKKYKVLGQSYLGFTPHEKAKQEQRTTREWTIQEVRDWEIFKLKQKVTQMKSPKHIAYKFLIQRKNFIGFFYGDKEVLILFRGEFTQTRVDTIRIHSDKHLIYRKGMLTSQRMEMVDIVDDTTERLMSDHYVDSRGQQMKDFSRIRTDYAHEEKMKDKDIEVEDRKEKGKRHG
jgi:hypothetical protein